MHPQLVDLGEASLAGSGQRIDVPVGSTFVSITITAVSDRAGATDPGASAVGFAELGLGAHREVVRLPTDTTTVAPTTPLAIALTRLRTDPLNRWRSDPEAQIIREFALGSARSFTAQFVIRRNARTTDDVLNHLAGVDTATSNRRLTGDPQSTAAHAVDGDQATAWTIAVLQCDRLGVDGAPRRFAADVVCDAEPEHGSVAQHDQQSRRDHR